MRVFLVLLLVAAMLTVMYIFITYIAFRNVQLAKPWRGMFCFTVFPLFHGSNGVCYLAYRRIRAGLTGSASYRALNIRLSTAGPQARCIVAPPLFSTPYPMGSAGRRADRRSGAPPARQSLRVH